MNGTVLAWTGGLVTVAASGGLVLYFTTVGGWEAANQRAGVIGLFVAIAGLVATVWGIVRQRRAGTGGQHVSATAGSVYQVRNADGTVRITSSTAPAPPAAAPPPPSAPPPEGSQSVTGSFSGPIHQIDGAKDVDLD
ncbi:hypothetical protein [Saccharopolyspora hordei]|uniref:Uncharacterized protein n=1 Tax=Saccharopolyspora hordei TaxID=1838 RepID=A0A853AS36_9PSEU|nr:hypothetical protein [Saccharopolyspora hordei]NYI84631.1 hypothetical protein [Saccharopolyspora hordei]